jgi:hypothetical protein
VKVAKNAAKMLRFFMVVSVSCAVLLEKVGDNKGHFEVVMRSSNTMSVANSN